MTKLRTIRKQGVSYHKIYKFESQEEMNSMLAEFAKYYKQGVRVLFDGKFTFRDFEFIESTADDMAWKDLNLEIDDFFIITKENLSVRSIEDERRDKQKRLASVDPAFARKRSGVIKATKKVVANTTRWTNEQLGFLWSGTKEEVGKLVGKKPEYVYARRAIYLRNNPNFIVPESCKTQRTKEIIKQIKNMKTNKRNWTKEELALIWTAPINELVKKLPGRSYHAIYMVRLKHYQLNPNFVAPPEANAKEPKIYLPKVLAENVPVVEASNTVMHVEDKRKKCVRWTSEEVDMLWKGNCQEVFDMLGGCRTHDAIAFKRYEYINNHPDFVVPDNSGYFKKAAKKDTKAIAQQIIDNLPKKQQTVSKSTSPSPKLVKNVTNEVKDIVNKEMNDLAQLLNSLAVKPKKITVNGIQLEF